jgi:hypothetical protein
MARICSGGELRRFFRRGGFAERRYRCERSEQSVKPPDIPWVTHRIVTSKYYRASLMEVQKEWSIDDVVDAHQALDYFGYMESLEMKNTASRQPFSYAH